ncbi:MAG: beta-ketoacyl-ACP synthase II [Bacillati bacterium ANGP1]|uniref:3-oxoacyl-[acyl-carrier-protein] synthase 2 n=1 Tax=Candidatus Segetimicrobium genomatis TaxID=2569760 RepID=A0A537LW09_9BACT|nr:MAG: beta-ketoacyl-ACP synthase II [Terrabacteria group bacterium ANGP1]
MARAVITGIGAVTPVGLSAPETWASLLAGRSGVRPLTRFDASGFPVRIAADVQGFDPLAAMPRKRARRTARFAQLAIAAAKEALADARLPPLGEISDRFGITIATALGGLEVIDDEAPRLFGGAPARVTPFLLPRLLANMASSAVSIQFGLRGPSNTPVGACASGTISLMEARRWIEAGEADYVLAGGTEGGLTPTVWAALCALGALSTRNDAPEKASRPFDRDRDGFVYGEGAVVFVVERDDLARTREAGVYAELAGAAMTSDAYHETAPQPEGEAAALAIRRALADAHAGPDEVDLIVAHGTGTPLNDTAETRAIKHGLGRRARTVPVTAPKSMVGHLIGAAGSLAALVGVLAIRDGRIPPTINLENPDPDCDLDYVPRRARRAVVRLALANAFGFGGQNCVVAVRAPAGR